MLWFGLGLELWSGNKGKDWVRVLVRVSLQFRGLSLKLSLRLDLGLALGLLLLKLKIGLRLGLRLRLGIKLELELRICTTIQRIKCVHSNCSFDNFLALWVRSTMNMISTEYCRWMSTENHLWSARSIEDGWARSTEDGGTECRIIPSPHSKPLNKNTPHIWNTREIEESLHEDITVPL